ncbi:MAG: tRNA (adenosine(37)-N6)-threonylcarbamoyltransferase complex transferase subunit TsaD [Nanoarchaeota archaeon]|nr:tRNA (adenosine(37)-N6)-threonylcarbamoyltransferase complex transferase subunit TsaD [Nanoarchaeota archaeon]
MTLCLGIESTAHTFGASLVDDRGKIYSNASKTFTTKKGGLIPAKLADHHLEYCDRVIEEATQGFHDFDLISYSAGPGIGNALRIGSSMALYLSKLLKKPLIGVNHCIAHLEIGSMLTKLENPILLYVSGANTQVIAYEGGRYRIFGETLDMGVGNFLDSVARELGLGFPGGPKVMRLAAKSKNLIELPYVVKGMDISLGGIFTNVKQKIELHMREDICYSIQETVFAMLLEVAERALAHCEKTELVLGGGVCCNSRLQDMAKKMCKANSYKCGIPKNDFLVDNAAMIAWTGLLMHQAGVKTEPGIRPYERTDQVEVSWRN